MSELHYIVWARWVSARDHLDARAANAISTMAAGPVSWAFMHELAADLSNGIDRMNAIIADAGAGLQDFLRGQLDDQTFSLNNYGAAVKTAMLNCIDFIDNDAIKEGGASDGYLLTDKVARGADGQFSIAQRTFPTAQTAPMRTALGALRTSLAG